MQYCSLHLTLLSPPDTSTTEHCSCFDPAASFFLKLLVIAFCSSPGVYWTPSSLGVLIFWCHIFSLFHTVHEIVKKKIARLNIDILTISELKWMGMSKFNSDDHYIYYCGQESLRRNGVTLIVNERVQNAVLECSLTNERMISVYFQCKFMPQPLVPKKLKLTSSMKTYNTF